LLLLEAPPLWYFESRVARINCMRGPIARRIPVGGAVDGERS
jgi:hypothetical protein